MENKAQGAVEYLLIISGAVLLAAVVIVVLTDIYKPVSNKTTHTLHNWLAHIN
jgi:hypothetical protein